MHSHYACPSYQQCQHDKDEAVSLDQTFNNHLLLINLLLIQVSFNDIRHLPSAQQQQHTQRMRSVHCCSDTNRGKLEYVKNSLSQQHFFCHKFHID
jgi:hypothetical protein